MARMSRVWFMLVVVLSLVVMGCTKSQDDALSGEPTPVGGEVPLGGADGGNVIAVDGSPTVEGSNGVASDGSFASPTSSEQGYPGPESSPADTPAVVTDTAPVSEPEATTVAITEAPPATAPADVSAAAAPTDTAPPPPTDTTYTVVAGDTLYAIAYRFNTTVEDLMARNGLTNNYIYIGQVLNVPAQSASAPPPQSAPGTVIHEVRGGEWLWSIARQYNTTPEAIMAANGLANDMIYPGQRLVIPAQ